ncbi:MAG TPA: hypothetical protein GXX40_06040 [Firmicutes bacterium]|nr:hypothetical protein [Bacillota bacterium]
MTRKTAVYVGLALLLVLAFAGTALAQTTASTNPRQTVWQLFRSKLAANLGIDETRLDQAFKGAASETLDAAVDQGLIPKEKADKMREAVQNGQWPWFWGGRGFGGPRFGNFCNELAGALGMTWQELTNDLKAGKTLEEIAKAKGLTLDQLKDKWLASVKATLDQKVQEGKLTSDQAEQVLSKLKGVDLTKVPFCKGPFGKGPGRGPFGKFRGVPGWNSNGNNSSGNQT